MSDEPADDALWRQMLSAGDVRQFGVIWDRHHRRVLNYLIATGAGDAADDLTAVVFMELWRRPRRVRFVDGSMVGWLLRTAKNIYLNHARSARRYNRLIDELKAEKAAIGPGAGPDEAYVAREAVREALTDVSAIDRGLIESTAAGASIREAAAEAEVSEAAAKMRLSRVRRRLRESFTRTAARSTGVNDQQEEPR